jgi:hypothetical protein
MSSFTFILLSPKKSQEGNKHPDIGPLDSVLGLVFGFVRQLYQVYQNRTVIKKDDFYKHLIIIFLIYWPLFGTSTL